MLHGSGEVGPPTSDRRRVSAGSIRAFYAAHCELAAQDDFDTLVVNGYRFNGANPSRFTEVVLDCPSSRLGPRPVDES